MLVDTSGFLCLFNKGEPQHAAAVRAYETASALLTHSYILAEFVPLAHVRSLPREQSLQFSARVLSDASVETVWVDEILHAQAVALLLQRRDKAYSLCDAVSFIVMRQRGIAEALTTDKHFEQEGFIRLLK